MDEPSTALTEQELRRVFATIRELVKDGPSILYVSHRLQEVLEIGHRATIMRDGRTVQEVDVSQVKEQDLVVAMIGQHRSLVERLPRKSAPREIAFRVDSLEGPEGVQVKDFAVRSGEIVGLAGLNGSGRTTFLRIIFGDLRGHCKAELFGEPYSPTNSRYAIARRIGLVPAAIGCHDGADLARSWNKIFLNRSTRQSIVRRQPTKNRSLKMADQSDPIPSFGRAEPWLGRGSESGPL
jgi:ribose transport system ATP-binding protein